jgi:hypothetical protein
MSVDGGPENKGLVLDLQRQFGINRVVASAYHPQGQGLIERGHAAIVAALKKLPGNWVDNLNNVLWADRVTVKRSLGETPAYMVSGREHILPIELSIPTWQVLPWSDITDTPSLLAMRARQFERRDARFQEAIARTVRLRQENKDYFDDSKVVRPTRLQQGDLVLLRDSYHENDRSVLTKFLPKWQGPFKIRTANEKGWYNLEELDGTPFRSHTPGNRLKKFHQRTTIDLEEANAYWTREEGAERISEARDQLEAQDFDRESPVHEDGNSQAENEQSPSYGQDIPTPPPQKAQPNKDRRRRIQNEAMRTPTNLDTEMDADEESDLQRAETRPKRLVAVKPPRKSTFNPADYQYFSSSESDDLL